MFGATGDLARRMLLPSLYGLDSDGLLSPDLRIVGTARTGLDDAGFRTRAKDALNEHLPEGFYNQEVARRFVEQLHHVPVDIIESSDLKLLYLIVTNCGRAEKCSGRCGPSQPM